MANCYNCFLVQELYSAQKKLTDMRSTGKSSKNVMKKCETAFRLNRECSVYKLCDIQKIINTNEHVTNFAALTKDLKLLV